MRQMAIVVQEPQDVEARLVGIGVSLVLLRDAILDGEAAREGCSPHDPVSAPGYFAWARTVRGLRDRLVPDGWVAQNTLGYPTVATEDGTVAIAVATGDEGTGRAEATPGTKHPKGSVTTFAVEENQLSLFPSDRPARSERTVTWILLTRRQGDTVLAELSRPEVITAEGAIVRWTERIILGGIAVGPEPIEVGASAPQIDVPVRRKSA